MSFQREPCSSSHPSFIQGDRNVFHTNQNSNQEQQSKETYSENQSAKIENKDIKSISQSLPIVRWFLVAILSVTTLFIREEELLQSVFNVNQDGCS